MSSNHPSWWAGRGSGARGSVISAPPLRVARLEQWLIGLPWYCDTRRALHGKALVAIPGIEGAQALEKAVGGGFDGVVRLGIREVVAATRALLSLDLPS
jgi:hypothetical protein